MAPQPHDPTADSAEHAATYIVAFMFTDSGPLRTTLVVTPTSLLIDGHEETLASGMSVTAEIKTGSRTVMSYLLSPLRRYAHDGIRER